MDDVDAFVASLSIAQRELLESLGMQPWQPFDELEALRDLSLIYYNPDLIVSYTGVVKTLVRMTPTGEIVARACRQLEAVQRTLRR